MNAKEARKWVRDNLHPQYDCNLIHNKHCSEGYLECLEKAEKVMKPIRLWLAFMDAGKGTTFNQYYEIQQALNEWEREK